MMHGLLALGLMLVWVTLLIKYYRMHGPKNRRKSKK